MFKWLCGDVQAAMWWVAHEFLVSAPVPFGFRSYWDLVGVGSRGFWDLGFRDRA